MARIKLTKFVGSEYRGPLGTDHHNLSAWPLKIVAEGFDIPSEIFVYQVSDPTAREKGLNDLFQCIASGVQLEELGTSAPLATSEGQQIPFYRVKEAVLFFDSPEDLEKGWERIKDDVGQLVRTYNSLQTLYGSESVTVDGAGVQVTPAVLSPISIQISYHPCGTVTLDGESQGIDAEDITNPGWRLVSSLAVTTPNGAKYYYYDPGNTALWDALERIDANDLPGNVVVTYNGYTLPQTVVQYDPTTAQLFWMDFAPGSIPNLDTLNSPAETFGNAPWPTDYVVCAAPGSVTPDISITIYPAV
jgi:hypothetical protein